MTEFSPGVLLSWQIGALEALAARHEYLERPHLLMGICKLEEALQSGAHMQLPELAANAGYLEEEVRQLFRFLAGLRVDATKLRRTLRQVTGRGSRSDADQRQAVHRSASTKRSFERAAELAERASAQELHCLHLLGGLLEDPGPQILQALMVLGCGYDELRQALPEAISGFKAPELVTQGAPGRPGGKSALAQFGADLTELARQGKHEPLIGRRQELLRMIRTLARKTKNNPLLLGDPGVGKTVLVRELAARIAQGNAPPEVRGKRIIELNMGMLVAGTKYRGEFEERLTRVVAEAKAQPEVILFLDEIHSLVGAGRAEGAMDAASLLKPALSQGEVRCIGATTVADYRKYFEKDAALARRFQPIMIEEPAPEEALKILEGVCERYEAHHQVRIVPSALRAAVDFARRHVTDRRLPDSALDLLDEACTRVKVGTVSFQGGAQGETPLAPVTAEVVAQVVSEWTGIPVSRLTSEQQEQLRSMAELLRRRVIGQDEAVEKVANGVKLAKVGLRDRRRPIGVFLFAGPTGVGKTELAKALAEFLFGSDQEMTRLDMSEYMERHSISRLIGAPPGYIGHDEQGQLTERLRRKPHSVVLLDEIEKAHPEALDLFLQLFDEGRLTDSHGRTVDGKNAIFIMTSNVVAAAAGPARPLGFAGELAEVHKRPGGDDRHAILGRLREAFRPEFLNRVDEVIVFRPLAPQHLAGIAGKMLGELRERVGEQDILLEFSEQAIRLVCAAGYDPQNGARPLARAIERLVARPLGEKLLEGAFSPGDVVRVDAEQDEVVFRVVEPPPENDLTR